MSFVSAATIAAAQEFSSEDDANALLVLEDSYTLESEPRGHPPMDTSLLSPFLSRPDDELLHHNHQLNGTNGLASALKHYEHSTLTDFDDNPFFDITFSNTGGKAPPFLSGQDAWDLAAQMTAFETAQQQQLMNDIAAYPLTPEQTASIYGITPRSDQRVAPLVRPDSISPRQFYEHSAPTPTIIATPQMGPSLNGSGRSSEDSLAPVPLYTTSHSPRVTVSVWDPDNQGLVRTVERGFDDAFPTEIRLSKSTGDLRSSIAHRGPNPASYQPRNSPGCRQRDYPTCMRSMEPGRPGEAEIQSINEIDRRRKTQERNQEVSQWVAQSTQVVIRVQESSSQEMLAIEEQNRGTNDSIRFGSETENRFVPGQTYYHHGNDAGLTEEDYGIILKSRNWADAPTLHEIQGGVPGQNQPHSSQAAIEKFEKMCRDNDSMISRAATWGTRRRSLPSVVDLDIEGITSGNFLKKLSISRNNGSGSKPGNLLRDLRGFVRRPSAATLRKRSRSRSGQADAMSGQQQQQQEHQTEEPPLSKRDSISHLSPVSRTTSWGRKATPSINEALVSMGQNFASIGAGRHTRSGSVSNLPPPEAPSKSSLSGLSVKNSIRRPRSKSDLPKSSGHGEIHSKLADLWWKSGGPPGVSMISRAHPEPDEEEDEDDESFEEHDMKVDPNLMDGIVPNIAGFQSHILALNPSLSTQSYLVERISRQQVDRYKQLLTSRVRHLGLGAACPCGSLCLAMHGAAVLLDSKGAIRGSDPLSTGFDNDDNVGAEGAITQESFPADIPLPPTQRLPAEFECQLCFQQKKLNKPSDWTKHVHEDVQPFTCTWEKCRDPKMFKRKADWVRHENEGHRQIEWWACDVDDCRHVCYRRDNFLQHLVREHKFIEPKVKNKAALKKAISVDPTWKKVEQCHRETDRQPQDEPCKFCGKVFPTWKKLTVHLAKHMEKIALPVLRLVAARANDLDADTVISPILDRPSRQGTQGLGEQRSSANAAAAAAASATASSSFDSALYSITSQLQDTASFSSQQAMLPQGLASQHPQHQPEISFPLVPSSGPFQPHFYSQQMIQNIGQGQQLPPSMGFAGQVSQGVPPNVRIGCGAGLVQGANSFAMGIPGQNFIADQFPDMNGLGLQNLAVSHAAGQLMLDGMMDMSSGNGSPFSGQESLSPYTRSPRPQAGIWDDVQYSGL